MITLHVHIPEFEDPPDRVYYLLASTGLFLVSKSELFTAVTPARHDVERLAPQSPALTLTMRRIPRQVMERIFGFFQTVFRLHEGEAVVILFYHPVTGDFRIGIPPQRLVRYPSHDGWRTVLRVSYGYVPRLDGFLKIGDVHSHADRPAFFSCDDDRDDAEDGLRIVLGRLHRRHPDVRVSFVTNGVRFMIEAAQILEPFSAPLTPPRAWLERVTRQDADDGREPRTDARTRL